MEHLENKDDRKKSVSRIWRRRRSPSDLDIKASGGFLDVFDNSVKEIYRINDEEYDYLANNLTEEESILFLNENPSFSEKRKLISVLETHLGNFISGVF